MAIRLIRLLGSIGRARGQISPRFEEKDTSTSVSYINSYARRTVRSWVSNIVSVIKASWDEDE